MKKLFLLLVLPSFIFADVSVTPAPGAPVTGGSGYIQNTATLQTGATFYVSKGTIEGVLSVGPVGTLNVSTNLVVSGHVILSDNGLIDTIQSTATVAILTHTPGGTVGTRLLSIGSDQQVNQLIIADRVAPTFGFGITASGVKVGTVSSQKISSDQTSNAFIEMYNAGNMNFNTDGGTNFDMVFKPESVEAFRISNDTGILATSSVTFRNMVVVSSTFTAGGLINLKNYIVATLPAGTRGDICYVTDALLPSFLANVSGGGAVVTPVFFDGANWKTF